MHCLKNDGWELKVHRKTIFFRIIKAVTVSIIWLFGVIWCWVFYMVFFLFQPEAVCGAINS
jgi:hypothetical protein